MMLSFDEDGSISTYATPVVKKESSVDEQQNVEKKEKTKPSDYDVFYG